MSLKICTRCKLEQSTDAFHRSSKYKDGLSYRCKNCVSEVHKEAYARNGHLARKRMKALYDANPAKFRTKSREFRQNNRIKVQAQGASYRKNNPDKLKLGRAKYRMSVKQNEIKRLSHSISCLIRISIKHAGLIKSSKTFNILGCDIGHFKQYIESLWQPWMNWGNYGLYNGTFEYGWDLDHIVPVSIGTNEEEILSLNYHTNFQPLCSKINRDIKKNTA